MKVNIDTSDMLYADAWLGFKGTDWKEEINVRDFIQHNYTPYEGDESFLAEATPATTALWEKVMAGIRIENSTHAPVDFDTNIATTITAHDAGYIEQELEKAYSQVGRIYIEYVMNSGEMPGIDVSDILRMIDPKMSRKIELEEQIIECQKRVKDNNLMKEKDRAEIAFRFEKDKLDRALAMDVISQDDYNVKLAIAYKKVENFEEIRKIEKLCDMRIITEVEKLEKLKFLTE